MRGGKRGYGGVHINPSVSLPSPRKGAHAITHVIAVGTYGKSKGGINQTQNFFGRSRNRIELRWQGDYFNYALQIRSIRPYAKETNIKYHVGLLWE